jgi:hypothetical protein
VAQAEEELERALDRMHLAVVSRLAPKVLVLPPEETTDPGSLGNRQVRPESPEPAARRIWRFLFWWWHQLPRMIFRSSE